MSLCWLPHLEFFGNLVVLQGTTKSQSPKYALSMVVMGLGQKFLTRVGSIFCDSDWVSHLWFVFEFGKFPLKTSNFSIFFPSGQKNLFGSGQKVPGSKLGWPLIYCGSKVSSGQFRTHLYSIAVVLDYQKNYFTHNAYSLTLRGLKSTARFISVTTMDLYGLVGSLTYLRLDDSLSSITCLLCMLS